MKSIVKKNNILLFYFLLINFTSFAQEYKSVNEVRGLEVGSKVKLFSTVDQSGKKYQLSEALKKGPVVLLFYRGQCGVLYAIVI